VLWGDFMEEVTFSLIFIEKNKQRCSCLKMNRQVALVAGASGRIEGSGIDKTITCGKTRDLKERFLNLG